MPSSVFTCMASAAIFLSSAFGVVPVHTSSTECLPLNLSGRVDKVSCTPTLPPGRELWQYPLIKMVCNGSSETFAKYDSGIPGIGTSARSRYGWYMDDPRCEMVPWDIDEDLLCMWECIAVDDSNAAHSLCKVSTLPGCGASTVNSPSPTTLYKPINRTVTVSMVVEPTTSQFIGGSGHGETPTTSGGVKTVSGKSGITTGETSPGHSPGHPKTVTVIKPVITTSGTSPYHSIELATKATGTSDPGTIIYVIVLLVIIVVITALIPIMIVCLDRRRQKGGQVLKLQRESSPSRASSPEVLPEKEQMCLQIAPNGSYVLSTEVLARASSDLSISTPESTPRKDEIIDEEEQQMQRFRVDSPPGTTEQCSFGECATARLQHDHGAVMTSEACGGPHLGHFTVTTPVVERVQPSDNGCAYPAVHVGRDEQCSFGEGAMAHLQHDHGAVMTSVAEGSGPHLGHFTLTTPMVEGIQPFDNSCAYPAVYGGRDVIIGRLNH